MSDEPYEPRYCEGCKEVYNLFEESHVAHDAEGTYRTAVTLEDVAEVSQKTEAEKIVERLDSYAPERHVENIAAARDRAALREAEGKLARLLRMADAWSDPAFGGRDPSVFAEAVRVVILP